VNKVSAREVSNTRGGVLAASLLGTCVALACGTAFAADASHFSKSAAMPHTQQAVARGAFSHHRGAGPDGTPACGSITITQSSTQTITALNSISCNGNGLHTDNSYFRAFDLASLGAPNGLDVCEVQVGVEQATSTGAAGQPATINLYTTSAPFPSGYPGSLTQIGTASVTIPDSATGSVYAIPVTGSAPAGSELVVEVFTPSGQADGNSFFIGSNTDPQSGPSYLMAADCGANAPTDIASLGFPNMHIVLNAVGNPAGPSDVIFADGFDVVGPSTAPTLAKAFAPATVTVNANSVLTLTLDNSGNAGPATLAADLVDTFPSGLVVATPSDAATTCTGTATATAGGGTLTLGTGAQIPAAATCTVTVSVTSATAGSYTNTIAAGGLQTDLSNSAADASSVLVVDGGTHHAATYTDRATFITHVAPGFYENDFADLSDSSAAEPARSYSSGGFGYTVDTVPTPDDLWFFTGVMTTNGSGDQLVVTFTSGAVTAVGGNFFASDIGGAPIAGNAVDLLLSDGTTETFSTAAATDFRGFTTVAPITSISIDAPNAADPQDNSWSTMDNLIVGVGD